MQPSLHPCVFPPPTASDEASSVTSARVPQGTDQGRLRRPAQRHFAEPVSALGLIGTAPLVPARSCRLHDCRRPYRVWVEPDLLPGPAVRDLGGHLRTAARALQVRAVHPVRPAAAGAPRWITHRHGARYVARREHECAPRPAGNAIPAITSRDVRRTERLIVDRVCARCHPRRTRHARGHGIRRRGLAGQCAQHDRNAQPRPAPSTLENHHAPQRGRTRTQPATESFHVDRAVTLTRLYVAFFIEIESRRVHLRGPPNTPPGSRPPGSPAKTTRSAGDEQALPVASRRAMTAGNGRHAAGRGMSNICITAEGLCV